jgi:hypothetical protein
MYRSRKGVETYDSLILTLVEPRQIVESKIKACTYYVLPLLSVAAIICFFGHFMVDTPLYTPLGGDMNVIWLVLQALRCAYYAMLGIYCSLYCRSSLHALAYCFGLEVLLTIPYISIPVFFTCFGGYLFLGYFIDKMDSLSGRLIVEYGWAAILGIYQAGFMLVVIRILYQRSVNLIRYESHEVNSDFPRYSPAALAKKPPASDVE